MVRLRRHFPDATYAYAVCEKEMIAATRERVPDLTMMDGELEFSFGSFCVETMRKTLGITTPVIMCSGSDILNAKGLENGASAKINKRDFSDLTLETTLRDLGLIG